MNETIFISWIGRIRKALRHEFEVKAAPLDITAAQLQVLRRLWAGDGIPTSQLTSDAGSDGGTVTGVLDRLESKGLIRRERSDEDRRAVQIWLTPAGRDLWRRAGDVPKGVLCATGCSPDHARVLKAELEELRAHLLAASETLENRTAPV